jgi:hypothetical protein
LEQLVPHVGRWRKFIVRNGDIWSQLSTHSHLCAPVLETLVLDFITDQPETELFSGGASHLSSLELIGRAKFLPPLGSIKYLKLSRISFVPLLTYDQLRRLVEPMCSLTRLSIAAHIVQDAGNRPPIKLSSVLVLDIYFYHHDTDSSTFCILDFPAVESLTIHSGTDVAIRALTRVYPNVQSLTLANDSKSSDTENPPVALALDFISLLPAVRDVVFQGTNPSAILNALHNRTSTDELLWPDLSAITVVAAERAKVMQKKANMDLYCQSRQKSGSAWTSNLEHQTVVADCRAWRPEAEATAERENYFDGMLDSRIMLFARAKVTVSSYIPWISNSDAHHCKYYLP